MKKENGGIDKKEFAKICDGVMPALETIKKVLKEHEIKDIASASIAADGYLHFTLCGENNDLRLTRFENGMARIEESTLYERSEDDV